MASHRVVGHQRLERCPLLARHRHLHGGLVHLRAGQGQIRRVMLPAQRDAKLPPEAAQGRGDRVARVRVDEPSAPDLPPVCPARDMVQRPADELHGRRRRQHDPVRDAASQCERFGVRRGQIDRHLWCGGRHTAATQVHQRAGVRLGASEQQAHCFDGFSEQAQRALRLHPSVGEVPGRAGPQAQRHASRRQLLQRHRRHGQMHRMHDLGAHRHQGYVHAKKCQEEHRGAAEWIPQEQVAGDPQGCRAGRFRRLRLCTRGLDRVAGR